jgi:N-acetylglucosamine-6-phosphate deacetylase
MSETRISGIDPRTERGICVTVVDGVIARTDDAECAADIYLSPGLVDLQVNGFAGHDLNAESISVETLPSLIDALLQCGVTTVVPTLITASEEKLCAKLKTLAESRRTNRAVAACVPFVHVEGPHISSLDGYRGAHPAEFVRPPNISEFDRWQDAADGLVGMVTLSPHFDGSCDYIAALVQRGVHVALGHTHASPEQIRSAVEAGARLSTHLGNGIAQQIPRHCNPIWSQLADDRLTATFISDGHHLPAEVLRAMLRAKGLDRSVLVSDLVALAGMPPGEYTSPIGGRVELRPDGRLCIAGTELMAGSTTALAQCVARAAQITGIGLGDAIAMATETPGKFAGGRGLLSIGSRADLMRFRCKEELVVEQVWLAGESVFSAKR